MESKVFDGKQKKLLKKLNWKNNEIAPFSSVFYGFESLFWSLQRVLTFIKHLEPFCGNRTGYIKEVNKFISLESFMNYKNVNVIWKVFLKMACWHIF